MSSVDPVRELAATGVGRLTAHDAWLTVRHYGWLKLARESFVRFRYGDGFSHSRALGLQLSIATIPLIIAAIGLASALRSQSLGVLLNRTLLQLTPQQSDQLVRSTVSPFQGDVDGELLALTLGLVAALVALTTAMGQVERGANRIYGIRRDRPTVTKYVRAFGMVFVAGLPAMAGFAVLVGAEAFAEAVEFLYGVDDDLVAALTRVVGVALLLAAITFMLRRAPARHQPGWSLLALGGLVALALWMALTALLGLFLTWVGDIGSVYGPLTGVMALLIWAQLTASAILFGLAVSAQLENARIGHEEAALPKVEPPQPEPQDLAEIPALERENEHEKEKT
jgi:YihY family inner membrane protein